MSKTVKVKIPELVTITISGPTSTGKSIIMERINKLLRNEFNAEVVSPNLDQELSMNDYSKLDTWQINMVKDTIWFLQETNEEK